MEAMALGVPPVVTSVGGIPEAVQDGVNGFLVESKRPDLLANRFGRLLSDDNLLESMGQKANESVAGNFSIQSMVQKIEGIYESVLANRN